MNARVSITGMHCESCVKKIENQIRPWVQEIHVSLHPPRAEITTDSALDLNAINHELQKIGKYRFVSENESLDESSTEVKSWFKTYQPLFVIVLMITLVSMQSWPDREAVMLNFMAGFFIVFGSFKLFDLAGFKSAFSTYDLLAPSWPTYGLIYPFLELLLGFAFLFKYQIIYALWGSIVLMGFGSLGVINALRQNKQIRCACLGTSLNLPMSTITLIEDLVMVIMSVMMLLK
jgi:copper chaperone CopZ